MEYKLYSGDIKRPTVFRAVWKYPAEDFAYLDGKINSVDGIVQDYSKCDKLFI